MLVYPMLGPLIDIFFLAPLSFLDLPKKIGKWKYLKGNMLRQKEKYSILQHHISSANLLLHEHIGGLF